MIYDANYFCLLFCFGSSVLLSFTHIRLCHLCQAISMTVTAFQREFISHLPHHPSPSLRDSLRCKTRNSQGWSSLPLFCRRCLGAEPTLSMRRRFLHALAWGFSWGLREPPRPRESRSKKSQALHFGDASSAGRWLLPLGSQRHLEILGCNGVSCTTARAVASVSSILKANP